MGIQNMSFDTTFSTKFLITVLTPIWFFTSVTSQMIFNIIRTSPNAKANGACILLYAYLNGSILQKRNGFCSICLIFFISFQRNHHIWMFFANVPISTGYLRKSIIALRTSIRFFACVNKDMVLHSVQVSQNSWAKWTLILASPQPDWPLQRKNKKRESTKPFLYWKVSCLFTINLFHEPWFVTRVN